MASIINGESSPGYYVTPTGITIGGRTKEYATIADMLADNNPGKFARVADATGDKTVKSGAAVYRREGTDWVKVYEEESMDAETKITWDTLVGKPNVTAEQFELTVANSHSHGNISILNQLGVDTNGALTLSGVVVDGSAENANLAISRLDTLEPIVTSIGTTVDAHGTAISALQTTSHSHNNAVVLGKFGEDNGVVTYDGVPLSAGSGVDSEHIANTTIHVTAEDKAAWNAKQNAITGTEGQFVTIDANGIAVATTIDLSEFGSVKTVNNVSPDANGNVTIDLTGFYTKSEIDNTVTTINAAISENSDSIDLVQGGVAANMASINALDSRVIAVEDKAHEHNLETNYISVNEVFGCTQTNSTYKSFTKFETEDDEIVFSFTKATEEGYILITTNSEVDGEVVKDNKLFWTYATPSNYDGLLVDLSGSVTGFECAASSKHIIAAIADGVLYVRALSTAVNNTDSSAATYHKLTSIPVAGNLLDNVTVLSSEDWTMVTEEVNFAESTFADYIGDEILVNNTWVELTAAMESTYADQTVTLRKRWKKIDCHIENWLAIDTRGNLYVAGKNQYGLNGTDLKTGTLNKLTLLDASGDWVEIGCGRYHNMGMRQQGTSRTIYSWGQLWTGVVGNGISYRQDMKATYAWVNGTTTVHTFAAKPIIGATVYTFDGKLAIVGHLEEASDGTTLTVEGVTYAYDSTKNLVPTDLYTKTPSAVTADVNGTPVVYDDWVSMEVGYYHNAAIRKDANGKSLVYLWGNNEYSQFGNGNYVEENLQSSTLTEDAATMVELWSRATLIEDARFDDAVSVRCSHYGTFIKCADGTYYFAGCNKRNYLGTGTFSDETAFIPYFMNLSTMFRNNIALVATYGAMIVRNSPRLAEAADPVIKATLQYPLDPGQIDKAVTAAHNHSVDTATIDAAAILVSQFADVIPTAAVDAHSHNNLSSLEAIEIRNGVLYLGKRPYGGGSSSSSSGGTGVTVDPTNVQLDELTDVSGLSNLAGGFGFEVLSYRKVSDTEAYIHVAPTGSVINCQGRYVDLKSASGTEIISAEEQSKGLYATCSNATGSNGYIYCTKDLITKMEAVAKSSGAYLRLYYVDTTHASSPANGELALELTGAQIAGYGRMTWTPSVGSAVTNSGDISTDFLYSVGVGSYSNEEKAFQTIYDIDGNVLITEDEFENNTYYFEDKSEVTSIGAMSIPTGQDENGKNTYSAIYSDAEATVVKISAEVVAGPENNGGIYIKDGTMPVLVRPYMVPETFDENTFANGSIYIHTGDTNFSGMANQAYGFDNIAYIRETTAVDGVYPIKSAILRLQSALTDGDPNSTNYTPIAGSMSAPMYAAIYSPDRYSTSSVSGEYNSAVGFNSTASGNQVTVVGDFSSASGICNVVAGDMSHADGFNNSVIAGNSIVNGDMNRVGGYGNYVYGSGNVICGQYTYAFGESNMTLGVRGMTIGMKNVTYGDAIAIGRMNTMNKSAHYSIAIGSNLDVYAEQAVVIGQLANVPKFEGNFPGEDSSLLESITAEQYATAGYDTKWISYKNALVFGAGNKEGANDVVSITPIVFTKYIVRPNNAYFGSATGSSRSSISPYIFEPYMQHTFTGVINCEFTDAIADINDATKFTFTKRNGGRVKTFDPGIEINDASSLNIDLDFNKATRWKLKDTVNTNILIPKNFVDGAEAYIIVYGGVTVSWSAFDLNGNIDESEDANHFDGIVWVDGEAPRSVDTAVSGFQMVKLMVVDNTVVGELIVDTCP